MVVLCIVDATSSLSVSSQDLVLYMQYSRNNIIHKKPPSGWRLIDEFELASDEGVTASPPPVFPCPGVDVVLFDGFLSEDECDRLVALAESIGFTFWAHQPGEECDTMRKETDETAAFRTAHTIEVDVPNLARRLTARLVSRIAQHRHDSRAARTMEEKTFAEDMEEAHRLFEVDLVGTWVPREVSANVLLARYGPGGHFAPHVDGATIVDLNTRSMYTLLVYLNDVPEGGETFILSGEQCEALRRDDARGRYYGDPTHRLAGVKPQKGTAAVFYYNVLHEAAPVAPTGRKYILRGDLLYQRKPPLFDDDPNAEEAFRLLQEAAAEEANGNADKAVLMFMKVAKLSKNVAALYRM
jgi:hypothetical protein